MSESAEHKRRSFIQHVTVSVDPTCLRCVFCKKADEFSVVGECKFNPPVPVARNVPDDYHGQMREEVNWEYPRGYAADWCSHFRELPR